MPDIFVEDETKTATAHDLPWNVVVHNDPVNLMTYVTRVFRTVFGYSREKAERHMLELSRLADSPELDGQLEAVAELADAFERRLEERLRD